MNGVAKERGIYWKKWGVVCRSKFEGCLGFCDVEVFNRALLTKQG